MTLTLYAHPFSSYCQKVLTGLYENGTAFTYRELAPGELGPETDLGRLWPVGKFPVLTDGDRTLIESSVILEYLDQNHPGPVRLIPDAPGAALQVRFLDRVFDNYVMTPMQRIVADFIRAPEDRHPPTVTEAKSLLDKAYDWLDANLGDGPWAMGATFTLADCAAAPSLFYADWVHPIGDSRPKTSAYRARLLARPSFARAVDEARPYRHFFPPGAPDRD